MPLVNLIRRAVRTSGENPATSGTSYSQYGFTSTSIAVDDSRGLSLTAVYRSVVLISSMAASLPLHVYRQRPDGSRERDQQASTQLIWGRPNPEMSAQTFWEMVIGHEVLGDAFIWVEKNRNGGALALWPIEPERVQVGRTSAKVKVYQVDNELAMKDFAAGGEIIHVPNWSRGALRGVSPIQLAANALSLGLSAQSYAERFFSQGSIPSSIISTDASLSAEQAEALSARWESQRAGLGRAHKTAVLSSGAKFQQISVSPADAELLAERKFTVTEIARVFGVPPHKLYDVERSTSWGTGIEEQNRTFLTDTLGAHLARFEQAMNYALLGEGQYVKFNLDGLLRGTTIQRYQSYAMGYGRWLSTNDIRRLEDLPPVDGGDDVLAPQNLVPLDMLAAAQGHQQDGTGDTLGVPASPRLSVVG